MLGIVGQIHHRRFQARKAHIQFRSLHMDTRQGILAAGGLLGQSIHGLAAGVGQAQHTGRLVEALTGSVVPCGP